MSNQTVRIIGGKWRGKKIGFPEVPGLRPTPDRVKETLFNWLMHDIADSRCLDLFAGSGSLGIEACSRGAKAVVLVEQQPKVVQTLKQTLDAFGVDAGIAVVNASALLWLKQNASAAFDVVFLDPPFQEGLLMPALKLLQEHRWLHANSLVYVEYAVETDVTEIKLCWEIVKHKKMGAVECALLKPLAMSLLSD